MQCAARITDGFHDRACRVKVDDAQTLGGRYLCLVHTKQALRWQKAGKLRKMSSFWWRLDIAEDATVEVRS